LVWKNTIWQPCSRVKNAPFLGHSYDRMQHCKQQLTTQPRDSQDLGLMLLLKNIFVENLAKMYVFERLVYAKNES
jgi:hypothetical protein